MEDDDEDNNEEDEDNEDNEDNEDEDDEDEDNEDEDDEDEEGSDKGSDEGSEDPKKKPLPVKLSKFQSIMNAIRDINSDMASMDADVDRIYSKTMTERSMKERSKVPPPRRNYHEAIDREEIKKSFSPQRRGQSDDYDDRYDHEEFNDRAGGGMRD